MLKDVRKFNKAMGVIYLVVITLFIVLHATPELAVRSALLTHGHVAAAVTSEIRVEENDEQLIYTVEPAPVEKATNTSMDKFYVKRCILFFAELGQA